MPIKHINNRAKGVHIKLDHDTHKRFKLNLVNQGLTMQDAFEEFARLVGEGNPTAIAILNRMIKDRVKTELMSVGLVPGPDRPKAKMLGELDSDRLYDLIKDPDEILPSQRRRRDEAA